MATAPRTVTDQDQDIAYPTRDGRPLGETDLHRNKMLDLIETLEDHFTGDPNIYVSGNLLVFYERGDRRKHVARRVRGTWRTQEAVAGSLLDLKQA